MKLPQTFIILISVVTTTARLVQSPEEPYPWLSELRKKATPVFDQASGTLRYRKKFVRSDSDTNEYTRFAFDSTVKKDAILFLDDERHKISKVTCSAKWLNISFGKNGDIDYFKNTQALLVHGSSSWGCLNEHNEPASIFKKMKSLLIDTQGTSRSTLTFEADDCSPFLFFGASTVSFFTNHSMIDVHDLRSMLKEAGGDPHSLDAAKSARGNLRAAYPESQKPMGYGSSFGLFNWNYDAVSDGAVQNTITVVDNADALVTCTDCFLYASGGFGFEFETTEDDSLLPALAYLKVWIDADYSLSLNVDMQSRRAAAPAAGAGGPAANYWVQEQVSGANITAIAPSQFKNTKKVFKSDISIQIAGVSFGVNMYLPVFLQLGGLQADAAGLTLSAGAFLGNKATHGLAYAGAPGACTMAGCKALPATCTNRSWCGISSSKVRRGGFGPVVSQAGTAAGSALLSPVVTVALFDSSLLLFLQLDAAVSVNSTQSPPASCAAAGRRAEAGAVDAAVFVDAAARAWARVKLPMPGLLDAQNVAPVTLFRSLREVFPAAAWPSPVARLACRAAAALRAVTVRTATASWPSTLRLYAGAGGPLAGAVAAVAIAPGAVAGDMEVSGSALPGFAFAAADILPAIANYTAAGAAVLLLPHGATFSTPVGVRLELPPALAAQLATLGCGAAAPAAARLGLVVLRRRDDGAATPWEEVADVGCPAGGTQIRFNTSSFSTYAVATRPLAANVGVKPAAGLAPSARPGPLWAASVTLALAVALAIPGRMLRG